MHERTRAQAGSDGICWYCTTCKTTKSIRHNSFFSKSKLTLQQWFIAILWWSREYPVTEMAMEAEIRQATACDIYQWLQEVCSTKLLATPIQLGGTGVVVQIDESLFRHKPKVSYKIPSIHQLILFFEHVENTSCNHFRMVVGDVPTVRFGCLG